MHSIASVICSKHSYKMECNIIAFELMKCMLVLSSPHHVHFFVRFGIPHGMRKSLKLAALLISLKRIRFETRMNIKMLFCHQCFNISHSRRSSTAFCFQFFFFFFFIIFVTECITCITLKIEKHIFLNTWLI